MSEPTPRTDQAQWLTLDRMGNPQKVTHAGFSRELERTLSAQRTALLALADEIERTGRQGDANRLREILGG